MKIKHIIYDSIGNPWLGGGGAIRTFELYKTFPGGTVEILCGNFPNAPKDMQGIRYRRFGFGTNYTVSRITFFLFVFLHVIFSRADLWVEDIGFPSPLFVTTTKKNYLANLQFIPTEAFREKRKLTGALYLWIFKKGLRFYKRFITICKYASETIVRLNPDAQISIIRNGVHLPEHVTMKRGEYLLYMGRVDVRGKGLDVLLAALALLTFRQKLIIAGGGESRELIKLKNLIKEQHLTDRVELVGFVDGEKKKQLLQNCHALVLPSRYEVSPISIVESFAYGKPVIASKVGGMSELIDESRGGWSYDVENIDSLVQLISLARNDNTEWEHKSRSANKFAKSLSWDAISREYYALLISRMGK